VGCERVFIRAIRILNDRQGPNTDGIDPDCCKGVIISDCYFDVGDDCIALKSGTEKLGAVRAGTVFQSGNRG
jgi:polygalacturonase